MVLEPNEILGLAIERADAINAYWNIFIAVATTIAGLMASGRGFTRNRTLKIILTLAFVVFAFSNLAAIIRLGELRTALLEILPIALPNRAALIVSLRPAERWQYIGFHVLLDVVVVVSIWFVPWARSADST